MIKKIEILGIQLDNYTVREAMLQAELFLDDKVMNIIEVITMETLVTAKEDEALRESMEAWDLVIINDKEILKAAGVNSPQRIKEITEQQFMTEFLKRIIRNGKTVYLFGSSGEQVSLLETYLREHYGRLQIAGSLALADCVGDCDGAINEINIISPDIIFSTLPTPEEELFLLENKGKIDARIWCGLGCGYEVKHGVSYLKGKVKQLIHKGKLHSMLSKYEQEKENSD
jgi:N-acetylglucosaminyldiphosphoundecaprenol N-acetyl-beta-D-mannosaminyltransferase